MSMPALKPFLCFSDASKTAGATATGTVDTLDTNTNNKYEFCLLALYEPTVDVVSNKPSVLKLSESDTTNATDFSDITEFVGGGTGGFTIATGNTSTATITAFNVDLRGRKRYLKLTVSPRTTQILGAWGVLARGKAAPVDATSMGVKQVVSS